MFDSAVLTSALKNFAEELEIQIKQEREMGEVEKWDVLEYIKEEFLKRFETVLKS